MKSRLFCIVLLCFVFTACSQAGHKKPDDISQEAWDRGLQYAIIIENYTFDDDGVLSNGGLGVLFSKLSSWEEKSSSSNEKELASTIYQMGIGKFDALTGLSEESKSDGEKRYKEAKDKVIKYYGKDTLKKENINLDVVADLEGKSSEIQASTDDYSPVEEYMKENNITLSSTDVQFDMANNLNNNFVVAGVAELDDYYNYGFDNDIEKDYFCARVTPEDGTYSDGWYLYFHRESFNGLYEKLKNGSVSVITTATIPKSRYEDNQGLMAQVVQAKY